VKTDLFITHLVNLFVFTHLNLHGSCCNYKILVNTIRLANATFGLITSKSWV